MSNALIVHLGSIDLNMIPMPTWYYSSSYEWHKVITNQLSYWACPWPLICMLLIVSVYSGLREKETLHAAWNFLVTTHSRSHMPPVRLHSTHQHMKGELGRYHGRRRDTRVHSAVVWCSMTRSHAWYTRAFMVHFVSE